MPAAGFLFLHMVIGCTGMIANAAEALQCANAKASIWLFWVELNHPRQRLLLLASQSWNITKSYSPKIAWWATP